jgi:hypothetical protein
VRRVERGLHTFPNKIILLRHERVEEGNDDRVQYLSSCLVKINDRERRKRGTLASPFVRRCRKVRRSDRSDARTGAGHRERVGHHNPRGFTT